MATFGGRARQLSAGQIYSSPYNVIERTCSHRDEARTGPIKQGANCSVDSLDFVAHPFQRFPLRIVLVSPANQDIDAPLNAREGIFYFMGQPRSEFAHEGKLCGTLKLGRLLQDFFFGQLA